MNENTFIPGSQYESNVSAEEHSQFTQIFSLITARMAQAMADGLSADSEEMQEAVRDHYTFILRFWTPNRETYKSLAMSYILPTDFKDHYDAVSPGLGQYIYQAVCIWADQNLE